MTSVLVAERHYVWVARHWRKLANGTLVLVASHWRKQS